MLSYAAVLVLMTLAAAAGGQTFGSLTGAVVDPLGAVLPNARVTLVLPARLARYEIRTDRSGEFDFQGLPSGDYQIEAETAGFRTYRDTIAITGQSLHRPITLQIGLLHETIRILESDAPSAPLPAPLAYAEPSCPAPPNGSIGGNLRPPRKIRDAKPDYPATLRGTGRTATLVVDARVGLDGLLKDFKPHEPIEAPFYDALAVALRDWRFSSTLLNCVPQEVEMVITATFAAR